MKNGVKISIITATYNRAHVLRDALESLERQTWKNWEHIVQDGGSTDDTLRLLEAYRSPRRVVFSERDNGVYDALNRAMDRATGDVLGILHSDDLFASDNVLEKVAHAFADKRIDAVYGDQIYVSSRDPGKVVRHWVAGPFSMDKVQKGWMFSHPTLFIRRHVVERLGGYDTSFRIAADYDAVLRWLVRGNLRVHYIPEVLSIMRTGGLSNRSLGNILRKSYEDYHALRRNGIGGVGVLAMKNVRKLRQLLAYGRRLQQ